MTRQRVLIVGGGFAGLKAALDLADDRRFLVTLITDRPDFLFYGGLYRTATGGSRRVASLPLTEIFASKPIRIIQDRAVGLDRQAKVVRTQVGHIVGYDSLILSLGVVTNFFKIKGLKDYAFSIKTTGGAEKLKQHLHAQLTRQGRLDLNYVVVGGGPTGIELAGALPSYLRNIARQHGIKRPAIHIDLIEAAPRLVPRLPKAVSRRVTRRLRRLGITLHLGKVVKAQTADSLMVNDRPLRSHTVIWTAGVANNPFFKRQGFQLAPNGKVRVDQYLQAETGIYVIGDNADTPYSGMAQVALQDGRFVASNLKRLAEQRQPLPYRAKRPVYVLPAGPGWAAVAWGRLEFYGRLGWWLRRLADFIAYHDYEPWQLAARRWLAEYDREETCPVCSDKLERVRYEAGEPATP